MVNVAWLAEYKWVILFYGTIIVLLYIYRKKFDTQGKFILLYRTKFGLKLMDRIAKIKAKRVRIGENLIRFALPVIVVSLISLLVNFLWIKNDTGHSIFFILLAIFFMIFFLALIIFRPIQYTSKIGIWVGYIGMLAIIIMLLFGLSQIIQDPEAPAPIQPLIPGVRLPGSPIKVPLIIGWVALFISAVVHEFSHGTVARSFKLKVKASGFAFIGPLGAAFVEPDEKTLKKAKPRVQNSIYAAGPFSNIILAFLVFLILTFIIWPVLLNVQVPNGFKFGYVEPGLPADKAGVEADMVYNRVDNKTILTFGEFAQEFQHIKAKQTIILANDEIEHTVITTEHPLNSSRGYIGVSTFENSYKNSGNLGVIILNWIFDLFYWLFIISLGLGLANLMPLGPVDGGRMFQVASRKVFGKKIGQKVWKYTTLFFILLLFVLLLPIIWATLRTILGFFFPVIK